MSWRGAHSAAMVAAAHAHEDLGVARARYVDVFAAITRGGLVAMGRPLGELFGMYLGPESGSAGVLVNSDLDETVVRHTAAHELGHHALGHGTTTDARIEAFEEWGMRRWPEPEKATEAFAAWFLMPRGAVIWALQAAGRAGLSGPADAYQLSLWLGTSFRGTVRHLANLKMISPRQAEEWGQSGPGAARRALDGPGRPSGRHWELGPSAHGCELHVRAGDRFTLRGPEADGDAVLPQGVTASGRLTLEVGPGLTAPAQLALGADWKVEVIPAPDRQGLILA